MILSPLLDNSSCHLSLGISSPPIFIAPAKLPPIQLSKQGAKDVDVLEPDEEDADAEEAPVELTKQMCDVSEMRDENRGAARKSCNRRTNRLVSSESFDFVG